MNVFYLDTDPMLAARYQLDKHVVKMPLETAQLLCTAVNLNGGTTPNQTSHANHQSAVWARSSKGNFNWLKSHGIWLCNEYQWRYHKTHKCLQIIDTLTDELIPDGPFTEPPQCMPDFCKQQNTVQAYRYYYNSVKYKIAKWKNRDPPEWFNPPSV